MKFGWVGIALAAAMVLASHNAFAQLVNGCPTGQAMQSSDASGRTITCVPIPDVGALEGAINAERTAREAMDGVLQDQIQDLRDQLLESSIVGRWAFSGTQTCLSSSRNFDSNFAPIMPPPAPQFPEPGQPVPTTFVSQSAVSVHGFRTFHDGGTGTLEIGFTSLNFPGVVYVNSNGFINTFVSTGAPGASSGNQTSTFHWEIVGGKLVIDDNDPNSSGTVTSGGRAGWITVLRELPKSFGVPGKDGRLITTTSEGPKVELSILRSPPVVQPPQEFVTPRICQRDRVLRKLAQ